MLDFEGTLQQRLNEAGVIATTEGLQQFDTDGSPITVGPVKLTCQGQLPKEYQTPYGVTAVARHVYQSSRGGKTSCPLDRDARIVVSSMPRFAKMIAPKYAQCGSGRVLLDLEENHGRKVARSFVRNVADAVATVALAQGSRGTTPCPGMDHPITTIAPGLDGTYRLMCEDGWWEAMVGTIAFYDKAGERQHTVYMAATPEYGKATSLDRMEREIGRVKATYPEAHYVGLADGTPGNRDFFGRHTEVQVVDYGHAVEYPGQAAAVIYRRQPQARERSMDESCHIMPTPLPLRSPEGCPMIAADTDDDDADGGAPAPGLLLGAFAARRLKWLCAREHHEAAVARHPSPRGGPGGRRGQDRDRSGRPRARPGRAGGRTGADADGSV